VNYLLGLIYNFDELENIVQIKKCRVKSDLIRI